MAAPPLLLTQGHTGRFELIIGQDRSHHVLDASYMPKPPKTLQKIRNLRLWDLGVDLGPLGLGPRPQHRPLGFRTKGHGPLGPVQRTLKLILTG